MLNILHAEAKTSSPLGNLCYTHQVSTYAHICEKLGKTHYGILPAMASDFYNNSVFWVEVNRILPNPFQPRKEFNEDALASLAESIRQYGILQPLVVTRREIERSDGGISVEYELVAGERRLRASKLASVSQVPVLIRSSEDSDKMKLELAIIENLQREDLNPIDRAVAFRQLADTFNLKHVEIAKKVGKSREYVSNSLRLLSLSDEMQQAVVARQITEGHTRPLLMLVDRPEQQIELFKEISEKGLTVRETERIARSIATDRARKQDLPPDLAQLERDLTEKLGTRVQIEPRAKGGKVHIDFFTPTDVAQLLLLLNNSVVSATTQPVSTPVGTVIPSPLLQFIGVADSIEIESTPRTEGDNENVLVVQEQEEDDEEDIYSIQNFAV